MTAVIVVVVEPYRVEWLTKERGVVSYLPRDEAVH